MQYFNKLAGIGRSPPPHQNGYYFMLEPNEAEAQTLQKKWNLICGRIRFLIFAKDSLRL